MRSLPSILSLFRNEFHKYKSTDVRFYLSYDIKMSLKSHFCRKALQFCHYVRNVVMDVITFPRKPINH